MYNTNIIFVASMKPYYFIDYTLTGGDLSFTVALTVFLGVLYTYDALQITEVTPF